MKAQYTSQITGITRRYQDLNRSYVSCVWSSRCYVGSWNLCSHLTGVGRMSASTFLKMGTRFARFFLHNLYISGGYHELLRDSFHIFPLTYLQICRIQTGNIYWTLVTKHVKDHSITSKPNQMIGLSMKYIANNYFTQYLTWMGDSGPENSTLRVTFCVESGFEVEHTKILHPEPKT